MKDEKSCNFNVQNFKLEDLLKRNSRVTEHHKCVKDLEKQNEKRELIRVYKRKRVLKPYCCSSSKAEMCKMKLDMEGKKKRNIQNNLATSDNLNQRKVHFHQ